MRFAGVVMGKATDKVIDRGREIASHLLNAGNKPVSYTQGRFVVAETGAEIGIFEVARAAAEREDLPSYLRGPLSAEHDEVFKLGGFPYGCHVCEVEIDPETGVTRVVRYTTVDDVGVAVNPMLVTGQVHGGVAQGIGQALYEGVSYDPEGQLLTASYQDYCLPRADDIPPIEVTLDGSAPCKTNPLGAKGCGESGAIGGPPCITNGVMDALSELGIKSINTPLSPLKVWQAIQGAKAARG
jgi:carbon-monoxide dehydrogenase large subunit